MPPAGLTMNTGFFVARSRMMPTYASRRDVGRGGDEHLLHGEPLDLHAEDLARDLLRLRRRLRELDAARLAAAAGVHLRLHDHRAADLLRDRLDLLGRRRDLARRNRHALGAQNAPSPDTRGCSRRLRCDGRSCLAAHRVLAAVERP